MAYRIFIAPSATQDIDSAFDYYEAEGSLVVATKWLDGLDRVIESLRRMPRRCSLAPENEGVDFELRQVRHQSHRVLFTIEGDEKTGTIFILRVYHMARRLLEADGFLEE